MKRLAIVVIVLIVCIGGIYFKPTKIEYKAPEQVTVEKEVMVDALEQAVKDAQTASTTEIEAKAKKAYDEAYAQEMKKVELRVVAEFGKKLETRQTALEKETSL